PRGPRARRAGRPPDPPPAGHHPPPPLYVEADVEHVALADDIGPGLGAGPALGAGGVPAAGGDQVVVGDHLGPDEALLEVGVDAAGRLGGGGAPADRPGPGPVAGGCARREEVRAD